MSETNKLGSLGKFDVFLGLICAILFADVIAANTSTGVPVVSWWIIMGLLFYIPNGLITAELSATYPDKGGIYSWVRRAFGPKWAARTSYYYWINNAIWISSAYIWFSGVLFNVFFTTSTLAIEIAVGIVMTWLTIYIASKPLAESKWVTNIAGVSKVIVYLAVIFAGAKYVFGGNVAANEVTVKSLIPTFDQSLIFLPVIIYSCCGLEVLSASAHEMKNPKRDLPRSIISVAIIVIVLNVLASLAMLSVVPLGGLDTVTGITDIFEIAFNGNRFIVVTVACVLLYGIFSQIVSWTLGGCWGAAEAGASGELPKLFAKEGKAGIPLGALLITGVTATVIFIVYGLMATNSSGLFYTLLAFSSIIFFVPYILMFLAYLKLKRTDKKVIRTFTAPAGRFFSYVCLFVLVMACVLFVWVPGQPFDFAYGMPIIVGLIVVMGIGEFIITSSQKKSALEKKDVA